MVQNPLNLVTSMKIEKDRSEKDQWSFLKEEVEVSVIIGVFLYVFFNLLNISFSLNSSAKGKNSVTKLDKIHVFRYQPPNKNRHHIVYTNKSIIHNIFIL